MRPLLRRLVALAMVLAVAAIGVRTSLAALCRETPAACHACCKSRGHHGNPDLIAPAMPDCCRVLDAAAPIRVQGTIAPDADVVAVEAHELTAPRPLRLAVLLQVGEERPPDLPIYLQNRSLLL